jgi:hypothetical protein
MFNCTCSATRGLLDRICGVNHPDCEALKGLSPEALSLVVSPTLDGQVFGDPTPPTDEEMRWLVPIKRPAVTTASTTVCR